MKRMERLILKMACNNAWDKNIVPVYCNYMSETKDIDGLYEIIKGNGKDNAYNAFIMSLLYSTYIETSTRDYLVEHQDNLRIDEGLIRFLSIDNTYYYLNKVIWFKDEDRPTLEKGIYKNLALADSKILNKFVNCVENTTRLYNKRHFYEAILNVMLSPDIVGLNRTDQGYNLEEGFDYDRVLNRLYINGDSTIALEAFENYVNSVRITNKEVLDDNLLEEMVRLLFVRSDMSDGSIEQLNRRLEVLLRDINHNRNINESFKDRIKSYVTTVVEEEKKDDISLIYKRAYKG